MVVELGMNSLLFPFYLVALPFIDMWNAVPSAFLIWAVVKDFQEKGTNSLAGNNEYYQTLISAIMLFVDSQFYILPALFGFIALWVSFFMFLATIAGIMFLVGVNLPIIGYTLLTILILSASTIAAFFWSLVFFGPFLLFIGSLLIVVPLIMWLSLDNTDKDMPFTDYLKNVYS